MTVVRRTGVQAGAGVCFVAGLMLFLAETRSTGEALERFRLIIAPTELTILGIVLMALAAITAAALFVFGRRKPE